MKLKGHAERADRERRRCHKCERVGTEVPGEGRVAQKKRPPEEAYAAWPKPHPSAAMHRQPAPSPPPRRWGFRDGGHKQRLQLSVFPGQLLEQELEISRSRRCPRLPQRSVLAELSSSLGHMRITTTGTRGRAGSLKSTKTPTTNLSPYPPGIE